RPTARPDSVTSSTRLSGANGTTGFPRQILFRRFASHSHASLSSGHQRVSCRGSLVPSHNHTIDGPLLGSAGKRLLSVGTCEPERLTMPCAIILRHPHVCSQRGRPEPRPSDPLENCQASICRGT